MVNTRQSPRKKLELNDGYVRWAKEEKTWLAEWCVDNRDFFCDSNITETKKCQAILEAISTSPSSLFTKREVMGLEMIRAQLKTLKKNYLKFSNRLNSSGEGLTAAEQLKFANLEGATFV
jgi:hypothetical protein